MHRARRTVLAMRALGHVWGARRVKAVSANTMVDPARAAVHRDLESLVPTEFALAHSMCRAGASRDNGRRFRPRKEEIVCAKRG